MAKQAGMDLAALDDVITGVQSLDQANYMLVQNTEKEIGDWYRQARDNPRLLQDPMFQMKLANLNNVPQKLAQAQNKVTEYVTTLNKGMADGTASDWHKQELNQLSAFFGVKDPVTGKISPNVVFKNDERGNTVAMARDAEGNLFRTNVL